MTTLYVGNLPDDATEDALRDLFAAHGPVQAVTLLREPDTGRLRGFGFVEMAPEDALRAVADLDGIAMGGCLLRVNEARDRGAAPPRRRW